MSSLQIDGVWAKDTACTAKCDRDEERDFKQKASPMQHRQMASASTAWDNGRILKGKGQL